jgi:hypothetical protein
LRAARFVRVSAWMPPPGHDKARLSEPISLRSPHCGPGLPDTPVLRACSNGARHDPGYCDVTCAESRSGFSNDGSCHALRFVINAIEAVFAGVRHYELKYDGVPSRDVT